MTQVNKEADVNQFTRKGFIGAAGAFASVAMLRFPANAAEFNLKVGIDLPADHPSSMHLVNVANAVTKATSGRVAINVFPNNQLGDDTQMLSQVRSGAMDFMAIGDNILATLVPICAIDNVGFAWKTTGDALRALDGDLGKYVRDQITQSGIFAFENIWDEGFREITTSTKPVHVADDLNGLKMRVPSSPISTSLFRSLGAAPTTISAKENYSALQTHIVDGQENSPAVIESQKLFEVQKFIAESNHMYVGYWVIGNTGSYAKMPKNVQGMVEKAFHDQAMSQRVDVARENGSLQAQLEKQGLKFNGIDRSTFTKKLASSGFYADWKGRFGDKAWSLLEKYTGPLA